MNVPKSSILICGSQIQRFAKSLKNKPLDEQLHIFSILKQLDKDLEEKINRFVSHYENDIDPDYRD